MRFRKTQGSLNVNQAILLAKKKKNEGLVDDAMQIYREILAKYPKNKRALYALRDLMNERKQRDMRHGEPSATVLNSLISLFQKGELINVLNEVNELNKQFPASAFLENIKGAIYKSLGRLDDAVHAYEKALTIKPDLVEAYNNLGVALLDQDKLETASTVFEKALSRKPDYVDACFNLGVAHQKLKKFTEAIKYYERAISLNVNHIDANYNLGIIYYVQAKFYDAIEYFDKALSIKPDYAPALNNKGNALQSIGKFTEALETYQMACAANPNYAEAFNNMGVTYQEVGNFIEAEAAYKAAIEIHPDYSSAHYNLGDLFHKRGMLDESLLAYETSVSIRPDYAKAHYNMGIVLHEQKKYERAINAYDEAIGFNPDFAEAYGNKGVVLQEQKQLEAAEAAYRKAISIKPEYIDAHRNVGNVFQKQGMLKEAFEAFIRAITIDPDFQLAREGAINLETQVCKVGLFENDHCNWLRSQSVDWTKSPKLYILNAIRAFLFSNRSKVIEYLINYSELDENLIHQLGKKDLNFCLAFHEFLSKLIRFPSVTQSSVSPTGCLYHLGESHCLSYAHQIIKNRGAEQKVTPRITFGAKAFHFSATGENQYKAITKANFESFPNNSAVLISFGEIDCRPNEGFIKTEQKLKKPSSEIINDTVMGYLNWFKGLNEKKKHHLHFFNVPAPVFKKKIEPQVNIQVAEIVLKFNAALSKYVALNNFSLIDVHGFTCDKNGFSNEKYHIDGTHLGPHAIEVIEPQLN